MKYDKSKIFKGKYLFHFHTDFTDGKSSIQDYFLFALKNDFDKLIFLEHIREKTNYDISLFTRIINEFSQKYKIASALGFESKVMPGGKLDITPKQINASNLIGIAEHSFPGSAIKMIDSLYKLFSTLGNQYKDITFVWVHPGLYFYRNNIFNKYKSEYCSLLLAAQSNNIMIEWNTKYRLIPELYLAHISPKLLVKGVDVHSVNEMPSTVDPEKWTTDKV